MLFKKILEKMSEERQKKIEKRVEELLLEYDIDNISDDGKTESLIRDEKI